MEFLNKEQKKRFKEVKEWVRTSLDMKVDALFEENEETLEILEKHKSYYDAIEQLNEDQNQMLKIETEHFVAEADRLEKLLDVVGLHPERLESEARMFAQSLQKAAIELKATNPTLSCLIEAAGHVQDKDMNARDVLDRVEEQCDDMLKIKNEMDKMKIYVDELRHKLDSTLDEQKKVASKKMKQTKAFKQKQNEYNANIAKQKSLLKNAKYSDSYSHGELGKLKCELNGLESRLRPVKLQLEGFEDLPLNVEKARLKLRERQGELNAVENKLKQVFDDISLGTSGGSGKKKTSAASPSMTAQKNKKKTRPTTTKKKSGTSTVCKELPASRSPSQNRSRKTLFRSQQNLSSSPSRNNTYASPSVSPSPTRSHKNCSPSRSSILTRSRNKLPASQSSSLTRSKNNLPLSRSPPVARTQKNCSPSPSRMQTRSKKNLRVSPFSLSRTSQQNPCRRSSPSMSPSFTRKSVASSNSKSNVPFAHSPCNGSPSKTRQGRAISRHQNININLSRSPSPATSRCSSSSHINLNIGACLPPTVKENSSVTINVISEDSIVVRPDCSRGPVDLDDPTDSLEIDSCSESSETDCSDDNQSGGESLDGDDGSSSESDDDLYDPR